ncbi:cytochrome b-c1 complex subunit 6-like protein [Cinnamomum micranthum f. kanehirae]|uniref:Complex III subunit VI n=1 Tax=Cinnamomum micranthum f. kanehirae TaxID=337451 RepID=A0A3S3QBR1_9MAGN|nr:cytochrome b-c1 complex subunit 6-like protein [Cinnamomum micranthum f. kanehirae]
MKKRRLVIWFPFFLICLITASCNQIYNLFRLLFDIRYPSSITMADEEPVDQKKYLEESCKPKCVKSLLEYQACVKRIQGDETGYKHCTGQYFDYWSCVDECVAPKLFTKLK